MAASTGDCGHLPPPRRERLARGDADGPCLVAVFADILARFLAKWASVCAYAVVTAGALVGLDRWRSRQISSGCRRHRRKAIRSTKTTEQDIYIRSAKIFWRAVLVLIGLVSLNAVVAAADASENFQVVAGVVIYLDVMPAQVVQGHPEQHPEAVIHGTVPARGHRDYVVAPFDNATGQRIENAQVSGSVMENGLSNEPKQLEPMRIADGVTYDSSFELSEKNTVRIKVRIRHPGGSTVIAA